MRPGRSNTALILLALLLAPVAGFGQDKRPEQGMIEAGTRAIWGEAYGRPDLPFDPLLKTSKYNEYRDLRDGFFIRRFRLNRDDLFGTKYFVDIQTDKAIYRDQSYLATFGEWNRFKVQFRYNEIPHLYSNTTRTLYTQTGPGSCHYPVADAEHSAKSCRDGAYHVANHHSGPIGAGNELHYARH